jgi:predicted dithiol-disulfide oxidoreductase (DUF899 family)
MTPRESLHEVRFPGESDEYRLARDEVLRSELALRELAETVARQRRALPLGGEVPVDYTFQQWDDAAGAARPVRLSELFEDGKTTLFLYSFMFVPDAGGNPLGAPCPSCTSIISAVAGDARDLTQRINFAVVARAPLESFRAHAQRRGWPPVRLLSSAETTYPRDYHTESLERQDPIATVFVRRGDRVHHFWTSELYYVEPAPGQHRRHVDFMWPLWNILDRTPEGRGTDWGPQLTYDTKET